MIIFLDLDGVMIPIKYWVRPNILSDGFPEFSQKSINKLNSLIDDNTIIYLTSSHKDKYTLNEWVNIFNKRGILIDKINRINTSDSISRKENILNYIVGNNITDYLIIDDDSCLEDLPKEIKKYWLKTIPMIGLN